MYYLLEKVLLELVELYPLHFLQLNIYLVIHMDPMCIHDEKVNGIKKEVQDILLKYESIKSMHDFRITEGNDKINITKVKAITDVILVLFTSFLSFNIISPKCSSKSFITSRFFITYPRYITFARLIIQLFITHYIYYIFHRN